ncbi:hypothetical protein CDL12_19042 [Handroanthus impetiginosus]|uniref:Uncharacterized protein n=1 Tax=Handroanthus impetiginosus TaxID=429701 RepID=A0A2G9GT35_9LAMI|nr:hypothetical protein CDL12_19042 [Handroanthus impetiginosus]
MEFPCCDNHAVMGTTSAAVITTLLKTALEVAPSCNDEYHDHDHAYINLDKTCSFYYVINKRIFFFREIRVYREYQPLCGWIIGF